MHHLHHPLHTRRLHFIADRIYPSEDLLQVITLSVEKKNLHTYSGAINKNYGISTSYQVCRINSTERLKTT